MKNLRKGLRSWQAAQINLKTTTIANVRLVLLFFEVISDCRDLSLQEWNFYKILQDHLSNLLEKQRIYWKQRGTLRWAQLGDAPTHFFHANATLKFRTKYIMQLTDNLGTVVSKHEDKEEIIWKEFKERLGTNDFTGFSINPSDLLERHDDLLQQLEVDFSQQEIDKVVRNLPNNKSPGPDGFTNEFLKASWGIIKEDFYNICHAFQNNSCCVQSINSSYITLIPKIPNPKLVSDFRPISLLNTSKKLITKLLALRLQWMIKKLIHKNQYGFIKSRTIQDCLAWAFEYLHLCHKSKK